MTELLEISIEQIQLGDRFRKEYKLDDLKESIQDKGIIQPITVTRLEDGNFLLVAGGRRFKAAQELGLESLPAIVRKVEDEIDFREIEILENAQRKDLSWLEHCRLVRKLDELMADRYGRKKGGVGKGWSQRQTAKLLNKAAGGISRQIDLANWADKIPQLREAKTEDEAVKLLRKLREALETRKLLDKREDRVNTNKKDVDQLVSNFNVPIVRLAGYADSHFQVGDAFEGLRDLINLHKKQGTQSRIALAEVDPPYGISLKEKKAKGKAGAKALDEYEEIDSEVYPEWLKELCALLFEALPDRSRLIFWFGQEWQKTVYDTLLQSGFTVDSIPCVWYKKSGQTNNPEIYLARTYESFFSAWKGRPPVLRQRGRSNVFEFTPVAGSKKYHPTQRPIALIQEILRCFAWPGGIILSPFLGSGATMLAAYRESMQPFGWDLSEKNKRRFLAEVERDIEETLIPICERAQEEREHAAEDNSDSA